MRRLTGIAIAIALAVPLTMTLASSPAVAGTKAISVTGSGACQADGSFTVTWTFQNNLEAVVEIQDAHLEGVATLVVFSPNPVDPDSSATATTNVAGTVKGELAVAVPFKVVGGESSETTTTVDLPGDCPQPIATTSIVTTTTVASTQAARTLATAAPRFTG